MQPDLYDFGLLPFPNAFYFPKHCLKRIFFICLTSLNPEFLYELLLNTPGNS